MNTVKEIEAAIEKLSREDMLRLREWFTKHCKNPWGGFANYDLRAGRLDHIANKALTKFRQRIKGHDYSNGKKNGDA
ncbi:MAG: hypothetical protein ABI443_09820 [Chthoniobacterales bacterium]